MRNTTSAQPPSNPLRNLLRLTTISWVLLREYRTLRRFSLLKRTKRAGIHPPGTKGDAGSGGKATGGAVPAMAAIPRADEKAAT